MTKSTARLTDRQAVYRCYDGEDRPLYIGTTGNLGRRLASHAQKIWFLEVPRITLEWYETEFDACNAEREAIQAEHPRYNIVHKIAPPRDPNKTTRVHPALARTRRLLIQAGDAGATPNWLLRRLRADGNDITRGTLQRWLRDEVRAGRAIQIRYGCYGIAVENPGARRADDDTFSDVASPHAETL